MLSSFLQVLRSLDPRSTPAKEALHKHGSSPPSTSTSREAPANRARVEYKQAGARAGKARQLSRIAVHFERRKSTTSALNLDSPSPTTFYQTTS